MSEDGCADEGWGAFFSWFTALAGSGFDYGVQVWRKRGPPSCGGTSRVNRFAFRAGLTLGSGQRIVGGRRSSPKHVGILEKDGHEELYLFIDTAEGLLTCVQMGTIEFHGLGARIEDIEKADRLVFDLDPDEGLDFENVRTAAFHFRDVLKSMGLETFPMLTGGKGVHVIAPLVPRAEWPEVKDFARRLAQAVAQSDGNNFTAALPKAQRKGRIFVDYLRNQRGATAVMPYAVLARPGAPVAAPVTWKEMETPEHY